MTRRGCGKAKTRFSKSGALTSIAFWARVKPGQAASHMYYCKPCRAWHLTRWPSKKPWTSKEAPPPEEEDPS